MQSWKFSREVKPEEWGRLPIIHLRHTIDSPWRFRSIGAVDAYLGLTPPMQVSINDPGLSAGCIQCLFDPAKRPDATAQDLRPRHVPSRPHRLPIVTPWHSKKTTLKSRIYRNAEMHTPGDTANGISIPVINRGLLGLLAIAAGSTVANNYYNQAMLGRLAHEFQLSAGTVSAIPVLMQFGNVAGILFLAPLGDRLQRRSLILGTITALIVALIAAAIAPSFPWLTVASMGIGLFATVTQQIVPLAVHLAAPHDRGRVLGIVTGGILIGILFARVVSGVITDVWGWPAVFWTAAGLMFAVATALAMTLPRVEPITDLSYARLVGSLWTLVRKRRVLRQAVTVQALIFAAYIGFWTNLALLFDGPPYYFGATAVGLMALVGVAGALAAPVAGRLSDRRGPGAIVSVAAGLVIAAFAIFGLFQGSLVAIIVGALILDLAVQSSQVANQARVFALDPTARSRLNTIFMATMVFGGACGAGVGGFAFSVWGWSGTSLFGAVSAGLALLLSRRT